VVQAQAFYDDSGLVFGPHEIGFMTIETFDNTRSFMPKYDYNGRLLDGERTRPIQICVWYPAAGSNAAGSMVFGEYVCPYPDDFRFNTLVANMQARDLNYLTGLMSGDRGMVQDLMNLKVKAVKNAPWAQKKFPVVIYHGNSTSGISENLVLCEYLASHGYIVAATHSMGARTYSAPVSEADIEAMTRDKEFAYSVVKNLENADKDRLGILGSVSGGLTAMMMQMRNKDADAVAVIDGPSGAENLSISAGNMVHLNYRDLSVPLMLIHGGKPGDNHPQILDSLRYSDRFIFACENLSRTNPGHEVFFVAKTSEDAAARAAEEFPEYETGCWKIREFLDAFVAKDENMLGKFKNEIAQPASADFAYMGGLDLPPREDEFVEIIRTEGGARGVELFEKFRKQEPEYRIFREAVMNVLGYELLRGQRLDDAREVLRLNTLAYPNSANCWDSYADALTALGDNDGALKCYKKVMEVLPNDTAVDPRMKEVILNNARERLGLNQEQEDSN
ncbi:MAG: hypothetical protein AB1746_10045, partial [Candidatus Zixiibacteriota bacterium]